ncbi:MAG: hypothetical protein ACOYJG_13195 [Prevotella sp.]
MDDETSGISTDKLCDTEVVVSLTTYGQRIFEVALAIESIMQGTVKPNHIVLWLSDDMKDMQLPLPLQKQIKRGLEIYYCKDLRSYKKLIPTLKMYPKATIITIDDDAFYFFDLVEKMVYWHSQYPRDIIANRIHKVKFKNNKIQPYEEWNESPKFNQASKLNFFTGVGGVLYPPHCLDDEVFNESVFTDICMYADDIWFYAMALKKGTICRKGLTHNQMGIDYVPNEDIKSLGLFNVNVGGEGLNDRQFKAVMDKYDLWKELKE